MKKLSKILVLVLAVALICTGLVLAVSADDTTVDLAAAIDNAVADDNGMTTVKLEGNATLDTAYTVTKNLTIDLGGKTLTSASNAFVIGANDITLNIIGEGNINVAGSLVRAGSTYTGFTVNIKGTENTSGIFVNHHDTTNAIVATTHGTFNMFNVNYVSNAKVAAYAAYFSCVTATDDTADRAATCKWNFNAVSFKCAVNYVGSHGNFIINLAGKGHIDIRNSVLYSNNSGINAPCAYTGEGVVVDGVNKGAIYLYNTILSAVENDDVLTSRNYIISAHNKGFGDTLGFGGTVTFENSVVESNSRLFHFTNSNPGTINFYGTTVRNAGSTVFSNPAYQYFRNVNASFYEGCRFINNPSNNFVKADFIKAAGIRTATTKSATLPSGMEWVYDPIGDSEAPYIAVETGTTVNYGYYVKNWNFESINFATSAQNRNLFTGSTTADSAKTSTWSLNNSNALEGFTNDGTGMQWHLKRGTLTHVISHENSYMRYWIEDDGDSSTTTRVLNTDPYLVTGLGYNLAKTSDGKFPTIMGGADRNVVFVNEFDFGTDSAFGYPKFSMVPMARNTSGTAIQENVGIIVENDGEIVNSLNDARAVTLNPVGQWNHASVVAYSDPANNRAIVYMYINGQYIGYIHLTNSDNAGKLDSGVFQGTRINISSSAAHPEKSALCIDNIVLKAYTSYQFEGERDSSYTVENDIKVYAHDGVYYPEKYITANPTHASMFDNAIIEVAGRHYTDINEAIKAANKLGVLVQLNGNLTAPQTIKENVVIKTNGYTINVASDSYGYVIGDDEYVFSDEYWFNAYWYNGKLGDLTDMMNDDNYVKTIAKVGHELDHANIFTEATPDYNLLKIVTQDGWAYDYNATEKVTSLIPTLKDLELALKDGSRATRFYPVITGIDMTYCIKNSEGAVYNGGIDNASATAALKSLENGHTFVLLDDIGLTESNLLFASTADTAKVIAIDLNGNTIYRTVSGVMFQVGAYTTLNVYSSVAGGNVVATLANASGALSDGGTAFVISDGTNNSAYVDSSLLVETRGNVTEAYINVGKFGNIPGSNMTVTAERAYYGFKGGENCAITSDGVNVYAPGSAGSCAIDSYVYDGNITFKNAILFVPEKDNVVNATGFSKNGKVGAEYPRFQGFENVVITADTRIENVIIINKLSGISDGKDNNVVSNNGDDLYVSITFSNVVAVGRINPSNATRNSMDGFVAAEKHNATGNNPTAGTITAICNLPMTWQSIDLGITESVLTFEVNSYTSVTDQLVSTNVYNIANNGTSIEGLTNAYVLPVLTGATIYEDDAVKVSWKGLGSNANAKTEYYVPGTPYKTVTAPNAAEYKLNAVKFVHDKTWTGIPAAGTVMTENVSIIPGYTVQANVSGLKANLSLYSDFVINVYIPENYAQYITSVNGAALAGETVTIDENQYYKVTASKVAKEASDAAVFEIALAEGDYTATKTVSVSITDYASTILAGEFTDADKVLMYNMLSFADAAFKYFNDAEDDTIASLLETYAAWNKVSVDKSYANALEDTGLGDVFTSSGIVLGDAPAFTLVPNGNFAGTVTVTYGDGNVRNYTVKAGSVEAIKIEGMKIFNFGVNVNITAVGTVAGVEQTVSGTLNLDTYAKYQTANAEENVVAVVEALYNYVKIAEQYKAGTLVLPEEAPAE